MSEKTRKLISIISPCFNEEDNVGPCVEAVRKVMEDNLQDYDYEHIFADNNSIDATVDKLKTLAAKDNRIKIVVNARNYGPFRSTFNALKRARGDAVLLMLPVDMQDPPECIPEFVRAWEEGFDVVYGVRRKRHESLVMRLVRKIYYRTVNRFANIHIPLDVAEFQLVDRRVHQALLCYDDHYPYIRGLVANCGFSATAIPYTWQARARGFSKNRLYHLIDQGLNGLISFTNLPMRLCTLAGFSIAAISILLAVFHLIWNLIIRGGVLAGIPTLIVTLFFFSGVQLLFIGILGEYIAAIHAQVRFGAHVFERETVNLDNPASAHSMTPRSAILTDSQQEVESR